MSATRLERGEGSRSFGWRLLAFGLLSRVLVLMVGYASEPAQTIGSEYRPHLHFREGREFANTTESNYRMRRELSLSLEAELRAEPRIVRSWYRWDALWYASIARDGYLDGKPDHSMAFMPLLPMIENLGSRIGMDRFWVGLIVPNLAFSAGLMLFGRVARATTGDESAAWRSCLLLTAYPWSFFFSAPYQESLSFALVSGALLAWLGRRPFLSAASLGVATAGRLTSASLSAALLIEWLFDRLRGRPTRNSACLVAFFGLGGAMVFFGMLWLRHGDPFLHFKAHHLPPWSRESPSLANIWQTLTTVPRPMRLLKDYVVMVAFLAIGVRAWVVRGPFWGVLILIPLLQGMSTGTSMSMSRVALAATPAFIDLGMMIRNRYVTGVFFVLGVVAQASLIHHFVTMSTW